MMMDEFTQFKEIAPFDTIEFPCKDCNTLIFVSFFVSFDSKDYGASATLKL